MRDRSLAVASFLLLTSIAVTKASPSSATRSTRELLIQLERQGISPNAILLERP